MFVRILWKFKFHSHLGKKFLTKPTSSLERFDGEKLLF